MTTDMSWLKKLQERRFLLVVVAVALAMRLFLIGKQSLWVDELLTLHVSTTTDEGINIWGYLRYNIHGPLHSFVVYLFHFVSMNDGWLRLPSALAGAGAVVYLYLWTRSWLGESVARIAAVILAVHPLLLYYSQEVRNYSFLLFFALMACFFFHRLLEGGRRRDWLWYVLAIAFSALSNFTAAFLFGAHTIIFFVKKRISWRSVRSWAAVSLVILALISPWVYRIYYFIDVSKLVTPVLPGQLEESERLRGETTVSAAAVPYLFYTFGVGFSLGPSTRELHEDVSVADVARKHAAVIVWVALLYGALLVWGVRAVFVRRMPWFELGLYFFVPILCVFALNWQNAKPFNIRYVLLALPAFVCVVSAGVDALGARPRKIGYVLLLGTLLFSAGNYYFDGRYARDDVKGAVRYVEKRIGTAECLFAPTVPDIVQHYLKRDVPVYTVIRQPWTTKAQVDAELREFFAGCNSFWYVRARPWVSDHDGYLSRQLALRYDQSEVVTFDGVALIHFYKKKEG